MITLVATDNALVIDGLITAARRDEAAHGMAMQIGEKVVAACGQGPVGPDAFKITISRLQGERDGLAEAEIAAIIGGLSSLWVFMHPQREAAVALLQRMGEVAETEKEAEVPKHLNVKIEKA